MDDTAKSWWYTISTFSLMAMLEALAFLPIPWPLRLAGGAAAGLLAVRLFILYHDFIHGAILRGSKLAKAFFYSYGVLMLSPPLVWRKTHSHHHAHTGLLKSTHVGSFRVMTTQEWCQSGFFTRLGYRISRHPLTIALGYLTVFLYGMCFCSAVRKPRESWDSIVTLLVHAALVWLVFATGGWPAILFGIVAPFVVSASLGAYLFYAQHNFEGVEYYESREDWSVTHSSLYSSSYLKLGPLMQWFTGNIGFHHVHHVNSRIPFYNLPAAMAAIPELQAPYVTTLHPRDVFRSFRLNIWDPHRSRMISYRKARARGARTSRSAQS